MRIKCPYCGERALEEFTYRGDATVTRPDEPRAGRREAWLDYVYLRDNPAGLHREHWYHGAGCQAWLVVTRNITTHEIARSNSRAKGTRNGASPIASQGGLIDRTKTVRFTFDGRSYRPSWRHAGLGAGRQRRSPGRALFQISSSARHPHRGLRRAECPGRAPGGRAAEPNTRATTVELFDGLDAASQNRWPSLKFDLIALNCYLHRSSRGFLLQDLHVAAPLLGKGL